MGRDGGQPPDRQARRPPADPHHAALAGDAAGRDRRRRARAGRGRAGLLGLPAGRRERGCSTSPPPRSASPSCARGSATSVGLAHGQQDDAVREAALAAFAAGRIRLLVATTVIEVGVDVPARRVMVIEHAERFGLAQLHQLRGRVGRGTAASFCLLLHEDGLNETARAPADPAARHRGRLRHRRRGFPPARRRRPARHAAIRRCPASASPTRWSTRACCTWRSSDAALLLEKRPET